MGLFVTNAEYDALIAGGVDELRKQYREIFQEEFPMYELGRFGNVEDYLDCLKTAICTRTRFVPPNGSFYLACFLENLE